MDFFVKFFVKVHTRVEYIDKKCDGNYSSTIPCSLIDMGLSYKYCDKIHVVILLTRRKCALTRRAQ